MTIINDTVVATAKRFIIMIQDEEDAVFEAFTFTGDPNDGINKAVELAPTMGIIIQRVWAEPIYK